MNVDIWWNYQQIFNCKVSMGEPGGGFMLFLVETEKLYDVSGYSDEELETAMRQSIEQHRNILFERFVRKELKREAISDDRIL